MRLLPRSLFARMVLVLLAGLVVAQLASLAVHWRERGEFMMRASGLRSAERIADIVRLLDSSAPADRARLARVLDSPPLRIALDAPLPAPPGDPELAEQAQQFADELRRALGERYPLAVTVTEAPPRGAPRPGYGMSPGMMGGAAPFGPGYRGRRFGGPSFVAQVTLSDGARITFDARQPAEAVSWPYRLLLSLGVLLAAVIAVTLVAVRWVTRPLKTLAAAAENLGEDLNRPPLDEGGPLEVSRAAHAFNTMQRRLARFVADRSQIFAAMSHDLKTPITRLRLRAEMLEDAELRAKFEKDLQEMEAMVSAALDFMRGVERAEPAQPLDVMALVESVQADARETGGEVTVEGTARASYTGHAATLKRLLANLVDNALKYGRTAAIVVEDSPAQLVIRVRDEGPGIPDGELERVFEPFQRLEGSRNRATGGSGLGLTIARNVARAHGGTLTLANRAAGGLEAVLALPRRA